MSQRDPLVIPRVAMHEKGFFWFDPETKRVIVLDREGRVQNRFSLRHPDTGQALDVYDIEVDPQARIVVSSWKQRFLGKFDSGNGNFISRYPPEHIGAPSAIAMSRDGTLAVLDIGRGGVLLFSPDGRILRQSPYKFGDGDGSIESFDVGINHDKKIYVSDAEKGRLYVFDRGGKRERSIPVRMFMPYVKLTVDPQGDLWVLNVQMAQIGIYSPEGQWVGKLGNKPGVLNQRNPGLAGVGRSHAPGVVLLPGRPGSATGRLSAGRSGPFRERSVDRDLAGARRGGLLVARAGTDCAGSHEVERVKREACRWV